MTAPCDLYRWIGSSFWKKDWKKTHSPSKVPASNKALLLKENHLAATDSLPQKDSLWSLWKQMFSWISAVSCFRRGAVFSFQSGAIRRRQYGDRCTTMDPISHGGSVSTSCILICFEEQWGTLRFPAAGETCLAGDRSKPRWWQIPISHLCPFSGSLLSTQQLTRPVQSTLLFLLVLQHLPNYILHILCWSWGHIMSKKISFCWFYIWRLPLLL